MRQTAHLYFAVYKCRMCDKNYSVRVPHYHASARIALEETRQLERHECDDITCGLSDLQGVQRDLAAKSMEI